ARRAGWVTSSSSSRRRSTWRSSEPRSSSSRHLASRSTSCSISLGSGGRVGKPRGAGATGGREEAVVEEKVVIEELTEEGYSRRELLKKAAGVGIGLTA